MRQPGRRDKNLHLEEWKINVPTIGGMYCKAWKVVYYFSGLGRPLSFKPGDFESDGCWFNHAWTLQETTIIPIIAGETGNNGMMEEMIQRRFSKQLQVLEQMQRNNSVLDFLSHMWNRVSTNPIDRVTGKGLPDRQAGIPGRSVGRLQEVFKKILYQFFSNLISSEVGEKAIIDQKMRAH